MQCLYLHYIITFNYHLSTKKVIFNKSKKIRYKIRKIPYENIHHYFIKYIFYSATLSSIRCNHVNHKLIFTLLFQTRRNGQYKIKIIVQQSIGKKILPESGKPGSKPTPRHPPLLHVSQRLLPESSHQTGTFSRSGFLHGCRLQKFKLPLLRIENHVACRMEGSRYPRNAPQAPHREPQLPSYKRQQRECAPWRPFAHSQLQIRGPQTFLFAEGWKHLEKRHPVRFESKWLLLCRRRRQCQVCMQCFYYL